MNSPALIEDDPLRDPAAYRARRAAAGAAWRQLAAAEQPDSVGLLGLLEEVARLDGAEVALPWERPAGSLPADTRDLLLADVDGDGHFEAVLVTGSGAVHIFRPEDTWESMGEAVLPADAPPVRGLESPPALYGGADVVRIVTGAGQAPDQLYELHFLSPGQVVVQELLHGPGEPARRRLALARSSEPAAADGLHRVLTLADDGDFLSITPLLAPAIQEPLSAGPTALVYATHTIFLADTRERIRRWEWREGTVERMAGWEVAVDGQVTALALIPTETTPLLLVATDERRLLAVEDGGDVVAQYALDTIWRAMAPQMARGELLVVADEGDVRRYPLPPLGEPRPRGVAPLPSLAEVAARLPADEVTALMKRWLNGQDFIRTRAAVKLFLAGAESGVTASPAEILTAVDGRPATARPFLETVEPLLLKIRRADDPRLEAVMVWAIQRAGEHHPTLQHRINRLTARLAARFPDQMGERPAWQQLDEIRRRDDRRRARELVQGNDEAELRAGLNTYAKILLERREERWIFATTGAVRAILPLPAPAQVLVATRDSKLYHLDLARSQVLAIVPLADGAIPRALTGGVLASGDPAAIMVTDRGELFRIAADGPAVPQPLPNLDVSPADPRALALIPATSARPAHFFAGGRDGQILSYRREPAGAWIPATPILLPDDIVHTLSLTPGDAGQPLLLVGCGQAGRGTLHQLTPDGSAHRPALTFSAPVLDARAILPHGSDRYRLIVLTANGYLHAVTPDGAHRWQYRVGRAARNLAVHDVNGDGQPEIIVGGRHRTVSVLNADGTVLWSIPARAPVTAVAALADPEGRPLLLISDLNRGLHVVGVNPPGSRREQDLKEEAEEALRRLADVEGSTAVDLIARWVLEAPTPLLRGYAFRIYGERFHLRQAELRRHLLAADVDDDTPLVQRAYARALVDALLVVPPEEPVPEEEMERLLELVRRDTVGLAILRALLHAASVAPALFPRWSPLLQAAAAVPDADVQRAVLYVLRRLRPWREEAMDLEPEAWQILQTLLGARSDADAWIARDAAALLRDLAGDHGALWTVAHRLPARLPESDLLARLGQSNPRLVDSFPLANALGALERLRYANNVEAAATIQNQISDSFARRFPAAAGVVTAGGSPPSAAPLVLFHGALAEASRCRDEGEWRRFVNRRRQPEGLAYLLETAIRVVEEMEPAGRALPSYLTRIKEAVDDFLDAESPTPEQLRRLVSRLRQEAELLVTIPGTSDADLILYRAVAGMLGTWVRPSGVLTRWFEETTRPATPRITVHRPRLQPDRIELTLRLFNPSHTEPIEELTIFVARATLRIADLRLGCRVERRQPTDGVSLPPQAEVQLRLQVPLSPEQREFVGQQQIAAHLDLPLHYFQPPRSWPTPTVTLPMIIRGTSAIHVDWIHDLPVAWQALSGAIEQARALDRAQDRVTPLLITCPPFARQGLVDYLQQLSPPSTPVIDLRQMVPHLRKARREEWDGGEAAWVAWLARHIWPQADPDDVARIEREGAPHHFFRTTAVDAAHAAPEVIVLDNLEGVLFGLAPLPAELGAAVAEALRFLDAWTREVKVQLVFLSTLLGEQMLRAEWPVLYEGMTVVASDRPVKANDALQAERVRMVERVLDIYQLRPALRRFDPPLDGAGIVRVAGGYLHVLDLLIFPALQHLQERPELAPGAARDYFLERAAEQNFFNALWAWQNFYERLALVILAYGEIPLEDRGMAEPGMVLSRDYFERSDGARVAGEPALPAGRVLTQRDVVTIRANRAYRPGDVHIRGMSPRQPAVTAWGAAGELLLDLLLRAGDGERLLARMEKEGALRRRRNRALGEYYELGLPLYEAWLHQNGVLKHILAAATGGAPAWYPPALAHDQRPGRDRLLFPRRPPGPARVDLPLEKLPEIQTVLNSRTQPLFLNLYGLREGNGSAGARWQQLVEIGRALRNWADAGDTAEEHAGDLLRQLSELLGLTAESAPAVERTPDEKEKSGKSVAAVRVRLGEGTGRLSKPALLLAIDNGTATAAHPRWLRAWIQERLTGASNSSGPRRSWDNSAGPRIVERDLVLVTARRGSEALRRCLHENGGENTFITVGPEEIARLAAAVDPPAELRALLRLEAGRLPFSPYQTAGSLRSAALFVGHDRLLNGILSRLPDENQLLLGSRGSGKSSLLNEVARRAPEAFGSEQILRLLIRLKGEKTVDAFYAQIRWQLEAHGHEAEARALGAFPPEDYADLLEVMSALAQRYDRPVLILADDVDALFRHDREENGGRFFTFLSERLSGAPGQPCAVVATVRPDLPLDGAASAAALDAFGRRHAIRGVDRPAVNGLVAYLQELNVRLEEPERMVEQVAKATGGIPRYVQVLGQGLLIQLDRTGKDAAGSGDVEAARKRTLDPLLRREFWDDLAVVAPEDRVRCRLIIATAVADQYGTRLSAGPDAASHPDAVRHFDADTIIDFLQRHASEAIPETWSPTPGEIGRLLQALTAGGVVAPVPGVRRLFHFPGDLLPDLLIRLHRRSDSGFDLYAAINSLAAQLQSG